MGTITIEIRRFRSGWNWFVEVVGAGVYERGWSPSRDEALAEVFALIENS